MWATEAKSLPRGAPGRLQERYAAHWSLCNVRQVPDGGLMRKHGQSDQPETPDPNSISVYFTFV